MRKPQKITAGENGELNEFFAFLKLVVKISSIFDSKIED